MERSRNKNDPHKTRSKVNQNEPHCERDEHGHIRYFEHNKQVTRNEFYSRHPGWDKPCQPWCELGKKGHTEYHTTSGRIAPFNQFAVYYPNFKGDTCRENLISRLIESKKVSRGIFSDKESRLQKSLQETQEIVAELQLALEQRILEVEQGKTTQGNLEKAIAGLKSGLKICKQARRVAEQGLVEKDKVLSEKMQEWQLTKMNLEGRLMNVEGILAENLEHAKELQRQLDDCKASEAKKIDMQKAINGLKDSLRKCKEARRIAESNYQSASGEVTALANRVREMELDLGVERTLKGEALEEKNQLQSRLEALERSLEENVSTLKGTEAEMIKCRNIEVQNLDLSLAVKGLKNGLKICKQARRDAEEGLKSCVQEVNSMGKRYMDLETTCNAEKSILEGKLQDCESTREGLQARVAELGRQADSYLATLETMRTKQGEYEDTIKTLTELRDKCEENSKLMSNQNERLKSRLDEVERRIAKAGDACFASSDAAMTCLQRMREEFPDVVALVSKDGKVESAVLRNGTEVVLPSKLEISDLSGVSIMHEEEKKEMIPIRAGEIPVAPSMSGFTLHTPNKKEGKGDLLAAIRGAGISNLKKVEKREEKVSPRGFSGADLLAQAKKLKRGVSPAEEEKARKDCESDMRNMWVEDRKACVRLSEEEYKAKCDKKGFPYVWKNNECVSGLAFRKAFVDDDEDWEFNS